MVKTIKIMRTDDEIRASFDPFRVKILWEYYDSKKPLTAKQVADKLGEAPSKVHYHIMKLIKFDVLELIKTKNINGIVAKYYAPKYSAIQMDNEQMLKGEFSGLVDNANMEFFDHRSDSFRRDIKTYINEVKKNNVVKITDFAASKPTLYMTDDEAEEITNEIRKLISKYTEKDDSKSVYTSLLTLVKIKE